MYQLRIHLSTSMTSKIRAPNLPEKFDKGGSLVEAKELSENLLSVSKFLSRFNNGSSSKGSLWIRDSVHEDMDAIK